MNARHLVVLLLSSCGPALPSEPPADSPPLPEAQAPQQEADAASVVFAPFIFAGTTLLHADPPGFAGPEGVKGTRLDSTSLSVSWAATGGGPRVRVSLASSPGHAAVVVYEGAGPSVVLRSGFAASDSPVVMVASTDGVRLSEPATLTFPPGRFALDFEGDCETATLGDQFAVPPPTSHDAYDPAVDRACETSTLRARHGTRSMRVQLTAHDFGSNDFPRDNADALPNTRYLYKNGTASVGNRAHRNEVVLKSGLPPIGLEQEHWLAFSLFLPGPADVNGDAESKPISFLGSYSFGPQLHPTNIPGQRGENPTIGFRHGSGGYGPGIGLRPVRHPAGAPVVNYQRGSDTFDRPDDGSGAGRLTVGWAPVTGASQYVIFRSVRPEGPFVRHATTTATSYVETGLGSNTTPSNQRNAYVQVRAVTNGVEGPASLTCPAPRSHWGASMGSSSWSAGDATNDRGRWTDWVMRYRLSVEGTGFIEVWKNDEKVVERFGISLGSANPGPHYWKFGIYHGRVGFASGDAFDVPVPSDWPWRQVIYYDEVRLGRREGGTSRPTDITDVAYQAVKPRGERALAR